MNEPRASWTDEQVEKLLGNVLRIGVLVAALVVMLGGALYLAHHGGSRADHRAFHGEPADLRYPSGILRRALNLENSALIQLGLLLLIATPILRIVSSVFAFARQRDYTYVVLTLIVLTLLIYSLFGGLSS